MTITEKKKRGRKGSVTTTVVTITKTIMKAESVVSCHEGRGVGAGKLRVKKASSDDRIIGV